MAMTSADKASSNQSIAASDELFAGSIPAVYDRYLVPLIFQGYADDLAARVLRIKPERVLETAVGTGVLTRALAFRLSAGVHIVATDLNQPMLDYAQQQLPGDGRIRWQQANALALPFADQAFDVVACQFGAMFFPDKIQGYREARRVLKPKGQFLFNVWDHISANDFAEIVTQALAITFPQDPPLFLARTPHGYYDTARIKAELAVAGFSSIAVDTYEKVSKAPSARDVAIAYCQGTPLRHEIEARDRSRLPQVTQAAADLLAQRFGSGPIEGRIRAHLLSAIR